MKEYSLTGLQVASATILFLLSLIAVNMGVEVTQRPGIDEASLLTQVYFSIGLFFLAGWEYGAPTAGPLWAQWLLWISYFGAPILTVATAAEKLYELLDTKHWRIRRFKNHYLIFSSGELASTYLKVLRSAEPKAKVILICTSLTSAKTKELTERYRVITIDGEPTMPLLLARLNLAYAKKVCLFGRDDMTTLDAATRILSIAPNLRGKLLVHCDNLRFVRALESTSVSSQAIIFNKYNLAANALVKNVLLEHFKESPELDVVILAGFGRFGQSVLEAVIRIAERELDQVIIIDRDAKRRALVVDEQQKIGVNYNRSIIEGDIADPSIWNQVAEITNLSKGSPTLLINTGEDRINFNISIFLKHKHPNAFIFSRTHSDNVFADEVASEKRFKTFSLESLLREGIPTDWVA